MRYTIQAACGCNTGRLRKNNEDNFYFDGKCLEVDNNGLQEIVCAERKQKNGMFFAVFDGMGGEYFGEVASYAAARQMQQRERTIADVLAPEEKYLEKLARQMNDAVVKAQQDMQTDRMGSTMTTLYFSRRCAYVCNVGDSRAYWFRDGQFLQISQDHVENYPQGKSGKAPLTQYLGINPENMLIEPYIAKGELKKGDMYLVCSDGLTDMLTDFEISDIMFKNADVGSCVQDLIQSALEHGGRDNITVIVCKLI